MTTTTTRQDYPVLYPELYVKVNELLDQLVVPVSPRQRFVIHSAAEEMWEIARDAGATDSDQLLTTVTEYIDTTLIKDTLRRKMLEAVYVVDSGPDAAEITESIMWKAIDQAMTTLEAYLPAMARAKWGIE